MARPPMLLALLVGIAAPPVGAPAGQAWQLRSGIRFEMSAGDLRASRGATALFSIAALLAERKREFDADNAERARELLSPDPPDLGEAISDATITYRPLSVVGPLVSLRVSTGGYSPGAAHPYAHETIEVVDVSGADAKPSLLEYWPERAVVASLRADPWVRRFLDPDAVAPKGETLAMLTAALNDGRDGVEVDDDDPCRTDAWFSEDLARSFAFHHLEGGRVAVRIAVPYATEVCRGTMHEVGLLLPIPDALRDDLARAADRRAGFLARDAGDAPRYSASWETDLRALARTLSRD